MVSFRFLVAVAVAASQSPFLPCEAQAESPSPSPLANKPATAFPTALDAPPCYSETMALLDCLDSVPASANYTDCDACWEQYVPSASIDSPDCSIQDDAYCAYLANCRGACPCVAEEVAGSSCYFSTCYDPWSVDTQYDCVADRNCATFRCLPTAAPAPALASTREPSESSTPLSPSRAPAPTPGTPTRAPTAVEEALCSRELEAAMKCGTAKTNGRYCSDCFDSIDSWLRTEKWPNASCAELEQAFCAIHECRGDCDCIVENVAVANCWAVHCPTLFPPDLDCPPEGSCRPFRCIEGASAPPTPEPLTILVPAPTIPSGRSVVPTIPPALRATLKPMTPSRWTPTPTIAPTTYDEILCSSEYLAYSDCLSSLPNGTYDDCGPCIYQYVTSTVDYYHINRTVTCAEFDKALCTFAAECQNACPCMAETMIATNCDLANCYNYVDANTEYCASDGNCQQFSCLQGLPPPVSKAPSTPSAATTSLPPSLQTASPALSPLPAPTPTGGRPCADERTAHASCLASTGNASACKECMSARFHGNYSLCNENLQYVCGAPQACPMCEACQGTLVAITNCYVAAVGVCAPLSCLSSPSQSPGAGPATSSPAGVPTFTNSTTEPTSATQETAYPTATYVTSEPTANVATPDPANQQTAYPTANFATSEPTLAVATPDPTNGGFPGLPVPTPSANPGPGPLPGMSPTPNSPPSANPGPRPLPGLSPTPNSPPSPLFLSGGARADSFDARWLVARVVGVLVVAHALL